MPKGAPITPVDVIGMDLGIVNLAVDSMEIFSGAAVDAARACYARRQQVRADV